MEAIDGYKLLLLKNSGKVLTFKWDNVKNVRVNTLTRINNIDKDYIIIVKHV